MATRTLASTPAMLAGARSCYDHLAGRTGVGLFDGFFANGALIDPGRPRPRASDRKTEVRLGPTAGEVFAALGVEIDALAATKRRFAFACLDWTERRTYLGGALGAAIGTLAVPVIGVFSSNLMIGEAIHGHELVALAFIVTALVLVGRDGARAAARVGGPSAER